MMSILKRELPLGVGAFAGILMIVAYYFTFDLPKTIAVTIQSWGTIVAAFALGLGVVNAMGLHIKRLMKREGTWYLSAWSILLFVAFVAWGQIYGMGDASYSWLVQNVLTTLFMAMVASTGFFITSAAFRAFTARTLEATLMLVAGLLVLLKNVPMVDALAPWLVAPGKWIFAIPLTAGLRGIEIGTAIGVISLGIRNFLGYEKTITGGEGDGGSA